MPDFPRGCWITGVGTSAIGRHLGQPAGALTLDACLTALADAGLEPADVDGLASYPGGSPPLFDVVEALGLDLRWLSAGAEGPAQLGPIVNGCLAVTGGLARHVLAFRTTTMPPERPRGPGPGGAGPSGHARSAGGADGRGDRLPNAGLSGAMEWQRPFGALAAANWFALAASRFLADRSLDRRAMAAIALTARTNAAGNPDAVLRAPMTLDDYLGARMISTPLGLYDCDVPCDGSVAFVISTTPPARRRDRAVRFEALTGPVRGRVALDQGDRIALWGAAHDLWRSTPLTPADVDVAQLYDGFSSICLEWLEAMGFCPERGVGPFLEDGAAIARDGPLPLNTGGGMLSAGRVHGFLQLLEACIQLRGDGGERQVRPEPAIAAVGVGGGPVAACALLSRGDS